MDRAKIALSMIVKPSEPPEMLKRCLMHVAKYVDAIYVTITQEQRAEALEKILELYNANVSYLKWDDNFADARNFNLKQIPDDYEYVIWLDTDDVLQLGSNIPDIVENAKRDNIDAVFCRYLYQVDLDERGKLKEVIIEHSRERIFRKKHARWVGAVHETIIIEESRNVFIQELIVVHLSDEKRFNANLARNIKILEAQVAKEERKDPRTIFYLGKAYFDKRHEDRKWVDLAEVCFLEYLSPNKHASNMSGWPEERMTGYEYLAEVCRIKGDNDKALFYLHQALQENDNFPSTYLALAATYAQRMDWSRAERWWEFAKRMPVPQTTMIINPRDWKASALEVAFHIGLNTGKLDTALEAVKKLDEILPSEENKKRIVHVESLMAANKAIQSVVYLTQYLNQINEKAKIPSLIASIPSGVDNEPIIADIRKAFTPERIWKDNEIAIFCGPGFEQWTPKNVDEGIGGSEEAVIYLSKELVKLGWRVTVYADPGYDAGEYDGVNYVPYFHFNPKDKFNILIAWRRIFDGKPQAKKFYTWLHDIPFASEFTEERLKDVTKVIVLSKWQRERLPDVPDDKMFISRNGVNV